MMPECTECNKPGPGCALHVYGTIKGEDHEAACVALLECALECALETYTLQYEYVPDDSSSGQATVEGVVATQIRKRPGRMRGNTRKDDEMTTIAYKTTCKAQQGQVNKSAVTLGLVMAQADGAVQLAPLWLVQDVSADDAYRVVPDLPTLSVPHAAIVSGMYREPNHDFERDHRVVPFAVYEIALEVVSGIEDLAALRVG